MLTAWGRRQVRASERLLSRLVPHMEGCNEAGLSYQI